MAECVCGVRFSEWSELVMSIDDTGKIPALVMSGPDAPFYRYKNLHDGEEWWICRNCLIGSFELQIGDHLAGFMSKKSEKDCESRLELGDIVIRRICLSNKTVDELMAEKDMEFLRGLSEISRQSSDARPSSGK